MELLQYWQIVRRHWRWPAALFVVALLASTAYGLRGANAYKTEMRLAVSTQPTLDRASALYYDPIYYANLSSEYLTDDLSEVLKSESFAQDVSQEVGFTVDPARIADVTRTKKTHRLIDVTLSTPTREEGLEIASAMERIINDPARIGQYLRAFDAYNGEVAIVNRPVVKRGASLPLLALEILLRALVGLLVGAVIAFVLDYLDQSLRTRRDVEDMLALPVLAEIPRAGRGAAA